MRGTFPQLIALPFTGAAFALLLVTYLDQISPSPPLRSSLHFLTLNTTNLSIPTFSTAHLAEIYTVGIWNVCASYSNGSTFCSAPKSSYIFNLPVEFGFTHVSSTTTTEALNPLNWADGLKDYRAQCIRVLVFVILAWIAAARTNYDILIACVVPRSAWMPPIGAMFTAWLSFTASLCATLTFVNSKRLFDYWLGAYGLDVSLSRRMLAVCWSSFACSVLALVMTGLLYYGGKGRRTEVEHSHSLTVYVVRLFASFVCVGRRNRQPLIPGPVTEAPVELRDQRAFGAGPPPYEPEAAAEPRKTAHETVQGREQV